MKKENKDFENIREYILENFKEVLEELGIDLADLDDIPDGLDKFLVDDNFLEGYYKELKSSDFDRAVYDRAKARLSLFPDRGKLARKTRIFLREAGKEELIDTQAEYIQARTECPDSTEQAYAGYVVSLKRFGYNMVSLVCRMYADHKREMEELKAELKAMREEEHEGFVKALDKIGTAPQEAQPQHDKKDKGEPRPLTPEEIAQAAKEQEEEMRRRKEEHEKELREGALAFVAKKMKGDEAAAQALLDGLEGLADSESIFRSIDEGSVMTGKLDWQDAYGSPICERYLLYAHCDMTADSLRNALRKLFWKKYKK